MGKSRTMKNVMFLCLMVVYNNTVYAETSVVTDCYGQSYTLTLESADTEDILSKIYHECSKKSDAEDSVVNSFESLYSNLSTPESIYGPLITYRKNFSDHFDQLLTFVEKISKQSSSDMRAEDFAKYENELNQLQIKTNSFVETWNGTHKSALTDRAKSLLSMKNDPFLPAELNAKIFDFENSLPSYLISNAAVPTEELDNLRQLQDRIGDMFGSLKFSWIEAQTAQWLTPIADKFKDSIRVLEVSNVVSNIEKQLGIYGIIGKEQKYAYFGATETAIFRLEEAINKISSAISSITILRSDVIVALKSKLVQIKNISDQIKKLDKDQNLKLLIAGTKGIVLKFDQLKISNVDLKERIIYLQEKIRNFTAILEKTPLNAQSKLEVIILLEQNYRQLSEIQSALQTGGVK